MDKSLKKLSMMGDFKYREYLPELDSSVFLFDGIEVLDMKRRVLSEGIAVTCRCRGFEFFVNYCLVRVTREDNCLSLSIVNSNELIQRNIFVDLKRIFGKEGKYYER